MNNLNQKDNLTDLVSTVVSNPQPIQTTPLSSIVQTVTSQNETILLNNGVNYTKK